MQEAFARLVQRMAPGRLVMTWHPGRSPQEATEVEVRFTAEADATTRVDLEHRGWEHHARGSVARNGYANGWPTVIGRYQQAASA